MKEEKAFVDFIIAGVLILSFSGFYLYKNVLDEENNIRIFKYHISGERLQNQWTSDCLWYPILATISPYQQLKSN